MPPIKIAAACKNELMLRNGSSYEAFLDPRLINAEKACLQGRLRVEHPPASQTCNSEDRPLSLFQQHH